MDCIEFMRKWVSRLDNKETTMKEFVSVVSNYPLFKNYDDEIPNGRLEAVLFNIRCGREYLRIEDYERLQKKLDHAESFLRCYVKEAGIQLDYFNET